MPRTREIKPEEMQRFTKFFSGAEVAPDCIITTDADYFGVIGGGDKFISDATYLRANPQGEIDATDETWGPRELSDRIELLDVFMLERAQEREDGLGLKTHSSAQMIYKV